jgi:IS605 OrfB family transposase
VEEALRHGCSYIAVEDLTHIRERMDTHDDQLKRQLHNWAFRELQEQIAYKAAEYGIRVESVNPAFSSQTCSKCGHQSSTNRDSETGWFACNECGYEVDGDYNAAKNVGLRLLALPPGKRPDGLGNGQLALKSGSLNVSDVSNVHSSLEFERESTDKPTASAVGS